MRHTLHPNEFTNFQFEHELAGSSGKGSHKKLLAVVCGTDVHFVVESQRQRILATKVIAEAVAAYNDEP